MRYRYEDLSDEDRAYVDHERRMVARGLALTVALAAVVASLLWVIPP